MQRLTNLNLASMVPGQDAYGWIPDAEIVLKGDKILWAGARGQGPQAPVAVIHDLGGRLITPALIDCHSHVIFGGNRAQEFEARLKGATYAAIAKAGGGILSTVLATRAASEAELLDQALPRIEALIAEGVGVVEVKSGYGLEQATELRMLRAARQIAERCDIEVRTSYLGAHAVPPEYKGQSDAYLEEVCLPTLRAAAGENLVDAVDGFCEGIAFQPKQIARVFDLARELGLPVKLHAEQLSNLGGAKLAASYGALSVDHVEYLDLEGVQAIAASSTVAVLLPGAFYTLHEQQLPPVDLLRTHKVPIALATDCNPGSAPLSSLLLAMNMGCTLFRLTPEEALAGVTRNAARALGLKDRGVIAAGFRADLAIWDIETPAELAYRIGFNPLHRRILKGQL